QQNYYWEYYTIGGIQYKKKVFVRSASRMYIAPRQYVPQGNFSQQIIPRTQYGAQYLNPNYPTQYRARPQQVVTADQGLGLYGGYNQSFYNNYGYGNRNYYPTPSPAVIIIDLGRLFRPQQQY
ncbi:hypothetical protein K2Q02_01580, partial [Patescibacteria group bacterium]|nr:hypothetical protein [Patescibacteria group bacterium]